MARYTITYTCGHSGELQLYGPSRSREWRIETAEKGLCPECYEANLAADRAAATEAAAKEATEQELPALVGTEKQVAWALTIRKEFLATLDQWLADHPVREGVDATPLIKAVESIQHETSAHWWIENRTTAPFRVRRRIVERMTEIANKTETSTPAAEPAPEPVPPLRPETVTTETIAEVTCTDKQVAVFFPERNDAFREVVKEHGFAWAGDRWTRSIGLTTGSADDRAAEIVNALLAAGFVVRVPDEIREAAVAGTFEPEVTRWVQRSKQGEFLLSWNRDDKENEKIYAAARKARGSKWSKPFVVIPAAQFETVIDIAGEFGFRLTPAAERLVDEARAARAAQLIVKPGTPAAPAPAPRDEPTGGIDASLRDDD